MSAECLVCKQACLLYTTTVNTGRGVASANPGCSLSGHLYTQSSATLWNANLLWWSAIVVCFSANNYANTMKIALSVCEILVTLSKDAQKMNICSVWDCKVKQVWTAYGVYIYGEKIYMYDLSTDSQAMSLQPNFLYLCLTSHASNMGWTLIIYNT